MSSKLLITTELIKKSLIETGNGFAIDMLVAIERNAARDPEYERHYCKWLKKGCTVDLREDLCRLFEFSDIVKNYEPVMKMPFANMWISIDSAWLHAKAKLRASEAKP